MSMTQEQIAKLLVPFPPSDIEYLEKSGRQFAYVSHPACTRRLIEVFGGDWSFEIVETKIEGDQVAVLGRLTCSGAVRMAWGGQRVMKSDLDDALKGAGSYSLKKCASLFGVGLHLWEAPPSKAENERAKREQVEAERRAQAPRVVPSPTAITKGTPKGAQGPLSERQMAAIRTLAKKLGISEAKLDSMCQTRYQRGLLELTRENATDVITGMQQRLNGVVEEAA